MRSANCRSLLPQLRPWGRALPLLLIILQALVCFEFLFPDSWLVSLFGNPCRNVTLAGILTFAVLALTVCYWPGRGSPAASAETRLMACQCSVLLWGLVSASLAVDAAAGCAAFVLLAGGILFSMLVHLGGRSERDCWLVAGSVAACAALQGVVALAQQVWAKPTPSVWVDPHTSPGVTVRSVGLMHDPNRLAVYLLVALPFAVAALNQTQTPLPRTAFGLAVLLTAAGLLVTYSRASYLGLAAEAMVLVWVVRARHCVGQPRNRRWLPMGGACAAAVLLLVLLTPVGSRMRSSFDFSDTSVQSRAALWRVAWHTVRSHPIAGVGLDNFGLARSQHDTLVTAGLPCQQTHNLYLNIAAESGLVGLGVFLVLLAALFRAALQARTPAAFACVGNLAGLLAAGLADSTLNWRYHPSSLLFWLSAGVLGNGLRRLSRNKSESTWV